MVGVLPGRTADAISVSIREGLPPAEPSNQIDDATGASGGPFVTPPPLTCPAFWSASVRPLNERMNGLGVMLCCEVALVVCLNEVHLIAPEIGEVL